MKKSLYVISLLILLAVFFVAGIRFNQRGAGQNSSGATARQILHYVDPMNPGHITKEPGIAPCGMPMEPVYADDNALGGSSISAQANVPGMVAINGQKQQLIGVQLGEVTKAPETSTIRALGRIVPDENRVYALIAPTDGWLEAINESTTGSMVDKDQLLVQIKIYNYDFYSWQQRFLTELGYTNRVNLTASPLSKKDQPRRRVSTGAGYQAGLPIPESEIRMINRNVAISQLAEKKGHSSMPGTMDSGATVSSGSPHHGGMTSAATEKTVGQTAMDHSQHMGNMPAQNGERLDADRESNYYYSSKGRLELLDFGLEEKQLDKLEGNGVYIPHVDIRSPVKGYVLERKVGPLQKIERGVECFRIADLDQVWIEADIYDIEAGYIQPGMQARISLPGQPAHFMATVSQVLPRFDAVSRSLKVRLEMDNPDYLFRPEMFVDVEFLVSLPESVSVPSSAVIDSGVRKTVYVAKEEGVFEPRSVATGWQANNRVEIVEGLQPGEKIVVSGNFLIDSESRMKLATAKLMEDKAAPVLDGQMPLASPPPQPQTRPSTVEKAAVEEKPKDLVCGMTVNPDHAMAAGLTVELEGTAYYFCSEDCKEQFKQNPLRYLAEKADTQAPANAPGHGEHPHD